MGSLFGTDGIRGVANTDPITPEVAVQVGRAVATVLRKNHRARIVIGKDTRLSGDMIVTALASGICSVGGAVDMAGVLPTAGVGYLTAADGCDAGIVVSASHNPFYDNGIKLFDNKGFKLSMAVEAEIEAHVLAGCRDIAPAGHGEIGTTAPSADPHHRYAQFLVSAALADTDFSGFNIVLDCANGATHAVAPLVFSKLGANVTTLFDQPDGININDHCGSQHIETLRQTVAESRADVGLAFDGDGDRLIAVDETGRAVTGDQILAICAKHMKDNNKLANNLVVSTVMSNMGLRNALREMDIDHVITDVGDRYVLAQMIENGAVIGGEDSGHMIFLDHHSSGDGILTAIRLMETVRQTKRPLSDLAGIMKIYPQVLKNVKIQEKTDIYQIPEIADTIRDVEQRLNGQGRVLVRYSGTQPLCRVMVEGPDKAATEQYCQRIVDVIESKIGEK